MTLGTSLIFQLRAGSNFTNECRYIRHLTVDPKCPMCEAPTESVEHVIEDCQAYKDLRTKLKEILQETDQSINHLKLTDITIESAEYLQIIDKEKSTEKIKELWRIDKEKKKYLEEIYKRRIRKRSRSNRRKTKKNKNKKVGNYASDKSLT
jgi:hypothetical protein